MLSRRNLRVKVLQALYAYDQQEADYNLTLKNLLKNINRSYDLLAFNLSLLVRIAREIKKQSELKASKFLPKKDDLDFNTRLVDNPYLEDLKKDPSMAKLLKLELTEEEKELVKSIYNLTLKKKEYKAYCADEEPADNSEKQILAILYEKVIAKSEQYQEFIEEYYAECLNDVSKIHFKALEIINQHTLGKELLLKDKAMIHNEDEFARELLSKTLNNEKDLTTLIQPKLENWDIDRIAHLDMIMMKMTLCELLYFKQIPVKVSINEYIEISKIYSTPKSKDFINGIIDKIMHELKDEGGIKKIGRGLVE